MNSKKPFTQIEKARRGWWASVVFMLMIVLLIIFLSYVKIVDENRDILVGIIGVITGSISGMLAIASGRDPSELDELKEELASKNADREALIARLRDAQIQMQLLRDQVFELQMAIINKLSMFHGESQIQRITEDQIQLKDVVDQWTPKSEDEVGEDS
ncbi:MAG: hypothetical protein ACO4AM_07855 [Candidatus Nanopelagicaceae bacterium]